MGRFREYLAAGGMPEAVQAFTDGKNYEQIDSVKQAILSLCEEDLKKYDEESPRKSLPHLQEDPGNALELQITLPAVKSCPECQISGVC